MDQSEPQENTEQAQTSEQPGQEPASLSTEVVEATVVDDASKHPTKMVRLPDKELRKL
jgi:glucose/arabinose dehydrogenase